MADRNGYIGRAPSDSSVTVARQTFSPTGVTTDFTFASGYVAGYFDIFINGVKMIEGSDYTSTDGSTFSVLNGGAVSGDVIEGVAYKAFNAGDCKCWNLLWWRSNLYTGKHFKLCRNRKYFCTQR